MTKKTEQGFIVPSVTEILGAVYGTGLEDAPAYFVERAAQKGTKIHKQIEAYLNGEEPKEDYLAETLQFIAYNNEFNSKAIYSKTEMILHAVTKFGEVCGTADRFVDGDIIDYKTSKTATNAQIKKWQMQLSFYRFMAQFMGKSVLGTKVLHITANGVTVIPLEYLGDDFVLETMRLYSEGKKSEGPSTELQTVTVNELNAFSGILKQIKALEEQAEPIREAIKTEMESRGILNLEIGDVSVSYVAPSTRKTFDSTRFKADHADLFAAYQKESAVKSSIRIKVN